MLFISSYFRSCIQQISCSLCMTVSRDLVNHKKMVVAQNRYQKWKKRDEISKRANLEATDMSEKLQ